MSAKTTPKGLKEVTYNDAVARSKEYFGGDELAATVWVSKYALKDSFGHIYESSPEDMHHRIAAEIERIEKNCRATRSSRCSTTSATSSRRAAR